MFNPEKLLGGLLMGGSRRRGGLGSLISSGAALGLACVAMEAMEHFMDKSKTSASGLPPSGPPPIQTSASSIPPPAPGVATPPPPPGATLAAPPPPPSLTSIGSGSVDAGKAGLEAVLLIRAMMYKDHSVNMETVFGDASGSGRGGGKGEGSILGSFGDFFDGD